MPHSEAFCSKTHFYESGTLIYDTFPLYIHLMSHSTSLPGTSKIRENIMKMKFMMTV